MGRKPNTDRLHRRNDVDAWRRLMQVERKPQPEQMYLSGKMPPLLPGPKEESR